MGSKELVKVAGSIAERYPALMDSGGVAGVQRALAENLDGEEITMFDLERVKVPSGGGIAWELPDGDGGVDIHKGIEGIVVFTKRIRSYWKTKFGEGDGNALPDCTSSDCVHGVGSPGGLCAKCPYSEFKSALDKDGKPARGQACSEKRLIFLMREGRALPTVLIAPPTSLKPLKKWLFDLSNKNLIYFNVEARFELKKAKNQGGTEYAEVVPTTLRTIDPSERERVEAFARATAATFRAYHGEDEEATEGSPAPGGADPAGDELG